MVLVETERLFIRQWVPDDWKRFRPLGTDPRVLEFLNTEPWSDERIRRFIDKGIEKPHPLGGYIEERAVKSARRTSPVATGGTFVELTCSKAEYSLKGGCFRKQGVPGLCVTTGSERWYFSWRVGRCSCLQACASATPSEVETVCLDPASALVPTSTMTAARNHVAMEKELLALPAAISMSRPMSSTLLAARLTRRPTTPAWCNDTPRWELPHSQPHHSHSSSILLRDSGSELLLSLPSRPTGPFTLLSVRFSFSPFSLLPMMLR